MIDDDWLMFNCIKMEFKSNFRGVQEMSLLTIVANLLYNSIHVQCTKINQMISHVLTIYIDMLQADLASQYKMALIVAMDKWGRGKHQMKQSIQLHGWNMGKRSQEAHVSPLLDLLNLTCYVLKWLTISYYRVGLMMQVISNPIQNSLKWIWLLLGTANNISQIQNDDITLNAH